MRKLAVVVSSLLCSTVFAAAPEIIAKVGSPAPAFSLKDEAGKPHQLAEYKGKIVVLEWTNPECPFVQRHYEAETMKKTEKAAGPEVVWLAVDSTALNTPEKSAAWKKAKALDYPILQDADGKVGKSYGAKTTPHMYVIDDKGVLRYAGAIDDDPRGTNKTPTNLVKAAVDAVKAGKSVAQPTTQPYGCGVKYKSS